MNANTRLLSEASARMINEVRMDFRRYLCSDIDWNNRLVCIKGAKGTGKTTLIRQHIRETFGASDKAFYASLDHLWFNAHDALELVDELYKDGVTHLFLDEVHHLKYWQQLIKNIYDLYPTMHLAYSGSSILRLDDNSGDLSRRQIDYDLAGLSFREYLKLEGVVDFAPVSLADITSRHLELAAEITRGINVIEHFRRYRESGYYPFFRDVSSGYLERLIATVNKVIDGDLPVIEKVEPDTIRKLKKMLAVLAETCPQTPKMAELYRQLNTDRNQGMKMLDLLERSGFINRVRSHKDTLKNLSYPEKLYCNNTNLMYALVAEPDVGTLRETFLVNQLSATHHQLKCPNAGDFVVDDKFTFEVGGKTKRFAQIADLPDSFVVVDDTAIGRGNKIPLWLFGFLY